MSFRKSEQIDISSSSSSNMYLANENYYDFQNKNKHENDENFKHLKENQFGDEKFGETLGKGNNDLNDGQNVYERDQNQIKKEHEISMYKCSIGDKAIRQPSLTDMNENTHHTPLSYQKTSDEMGGYDGLGTVIFENHKKASSIAEEEQTIRGIPENERNIIYNKEKDFDEAAMEIPKHLDDIDNESSSVFTTTPSNELQNNNQSDDNASTILKPHFSSNLDPEQLPEYKNENFLAIETKQQIDDAGKSTDIREHIQKHVFKSTNITINSNLLHSTKLPQNTTDTGIINSPADEQYPHNYNNEANNVYSNKSSTPTLPPTNLTLLTKEETSNESANNTTFENTGFQEPTLPNDSTHEVNASSLVLNTDTSYKKNEESSNNINVGDNGQHSDCNDKNLKEETTLEEQGNALKKLYNKLDNQQQKPNDHSHEDQNFNKYMQENSQNPNSEFETETNNRISHQQHEKDIIDAANKVYTQIEEEYNQQKQQVSVIPSTYGQMLTNHQQQQQPTNAHKPESHDHQQQIQTLQHSMQQHYSSDQIYQIQQEHQQQLHMQQHHMQKQEELQQHHDNIPRDPQGDQLQQHPHHINFLHPHHHANISNTHSPIHQHQQQIHEVYHDLMMEEFHEEHNTPYKLGLSPSTVKHENQDDGYETSAGDVLTPNSHASSSHSVTPHHMQHGRLLANAAKSDDPQQHNMRMQQSQQHKSLVNNDGNQSIQQELVTNESPGNITGDPYQFMDDDLNSAANNSLRNILTPPHSHTRGNPERVPMNGFMVMQSDVSASSNITSSNEMYGMPNALIQHHHSQKQSSTTNIEHQHFGESSTDNIDHEQDAILNLQTKSIQKRRGRKKKIPELGLTPTLERSNATDSNSMPGFTKTKERKKHDRFNGMSEEEVVKRILPDHLCDNLDIVIIGINPGLFAAYKGHHYAGPGNHFWKCLYLSGLTQEQMNADEDFKLIKYGIGFTNMVQRATKGSADLTRKEIKEGSRVLLEKLQRFRPKIAVFNGKLIFEVFSGKKDFNFGQQPECVEGTDTFIWVMPSSSARCAQLPRAADKVPFYAALKKFRDYLNGLIPHIDQSECVFTEERIKEQCEQENYKNQQNSSRSGGNDTSYQNTVGMSNSNNAIQNNVGYPFDAQADTHGAGEGPGPPSSSDNNLSNNFMMASLVGTQNEKKKRGRPKKIKGHEIIDPVTGNKVQVNSQMLGNNSGEYGNILNLSVVQVSNNEIPKKKRGRPKKVKTHPNMIQNMPQSTTMLNQKPNIMSIQSLTSDITQNSPHHLQGLQTNNQHVALYSTPPPHQRSLYSPLASPMASPSLNCSYTTNTPPTQPLHDKLGLPNNEREPSKTKDLVHPAHHQHNIADQTFDESPPPSSPNICAVDFEPPTASTATSSIVGETINSDLNTMHQRLHNNHQRSRFNSPISGEATPDHTTNEHFQQWLSPQSNHNIHSPAAATNSMFHNSPQQPSLNYHDQPQHQQVQGIQQQSQQHQELHAQWPLRHQSRYDDLANSPYLLSSQIHQAHNHSNLNHQSPKSGSDMTRKSLSGLESLVDQIPTISESESIVLSSAAAVTAQVAAAAAVESRLQGMQSSSLNDTQVGDDSHFPSITGPQNILTANNSPTSPSNNNNQINQSNPTSNLLNSNFSVSNLASSSASSNNNNHDIYSLTSNSRALANSNAYHHSNLMAAAVLAAAAANTQTPPAATGTSNHHASMYMDPHAHLTAHVPVNSLYSATAPPPSHHHHHSAVSAHHHVAAAHYGSTQHPAAADFVTSNNPYVAGQNNVSASHTLHMPSPNYPYGYPTGSSQSNYSAYPHSHHVNHHGHPHAAHHLAMFDRLKPSDITGYSTGF